MSKKTHSIKNLNFFFPRKFVSRLERQTALLSHPIDKMYAFDHGTVVFRRIFVMTTPLHSLEPSHSAKLGTFVFFQIVTGNLELIEKVSFYVTPFVAHDITFRGSVAFVQSTDIFFHLLNGSSIFPYKRPCRVVHARVLSQN